MAKRKDYQIKALKMAKDGSYTITVEGRPFPKDQQLEILTLALTGALVHDDGSLSFYGKSVRSMNS